jgi:hypothetical protein
MRVKKEDLLSLLRPQINSPGISDFIFLLNEYIEEYKEDLINAKGDDVLFLQGAIQKIRGILTDLKRLTTIKPFKNGAYIGE